MKKSVEFLDYLFLLRPTLFIPVWTFFLAGLWNGSRTTGTDSPFRLRFFCASALTLLLGGVYIINQIQDKETDRANGKLFLLANGIVSMKSAVVEATLLVGVAVLSGFLMDTRFALLLVLIFLVTGFFYNYSPFSWKNKPLLGLATNVLGGLLVYSTGWFSGGGSGQFPAESLAYACAVASAYLGTTLPDMRGDSNTGKVTFPVRFGIPRTLAWSLGFETFSVVLSGLLHSWILFFPALFAFPFFIRAAVKRSVAASITATKFSILALAISVSVVYPAYLLPLAGVFFASKWYYKKRFGFDYPSLKST